MDLKEQRGIVLAALVKITPQNGLWLVPSATQAGKHYWVNLGLKTCSCPDYANGNKCKHIYAAGMVERRDGVGNNPQGALADFTVPKKPTYKQDWPSYNLAQTTEKERFRILLGDLTKKLVNPPQQQPGRPRIPLSDVVFAATYKIYSTLSSRRFMTDLRDAAEKGFLSRLMHYNAINAYLEWKELTPVLMSLIVRSSLPLKEIETEFAADSTGFTTSRFVRWFDHKYNRMRNGHDWVKVHVMTGVKTNIITAVEIRGRNAGDAPMLRPLVATTHQNFKINSVACDKAYSTVENLECVDQVGGTPYIPFKVNASDAKGGLWEKLLNFYQLHREEFLKHYHKRSNAEATFSMIKAKFRDHVRSRTDVAMKNEVLAKVLCHNLCCVIQSQIELKVDSAFW